MFFDPKKIPADALSELDLTTLREVVDRVTRRKVPRIEIPDPVTQFRVTGMVRGYQQTSLYRCLHLTSASVSLVETGYGLAAMIIARSLMETIASFRWFADRLKAVIEGGDLKAINDFVHAASFATRLERLVSVAGTEDVRAVSTLTQIDRLKKEREDAREEYDHLCEYAHPNSFGTFLYFGEHDNTVDVLNLHEGDQHSDESFRWVGVVISMLRQFERAFDDVDALLPRLTELGNEGAKKRSAGSPADHRE